MSKFINLILEEKLNWPLWVPVLFGLGIVVYFQLPAEPHICIAILSTIFTIVPCILLRDNKPYFWLLIVLSIICLGFFAANIRTIYIQAPVVQKDLGVRKITAKIDKIQSRPTGLRYILKNVSIERLDRAVTPKYIRINVNTDNGNAQNGDEILLLAALSPPPAPVIPGGYDFARYAYFKQLGAVGYAVSDVKILHKNDDITIDQLRYIIYQRILAYDNAINGNIAAALLVGQRGGIDKTTMENIRQSGIAHILAISGMHLSMVAAIFFFLSRAIFSMSNRLVLHCNIKNWAAFIAILGSFVYLLISGAPISAQRAFIMTSLILIAITINRSGMTMRSIALAAMIILIATPESILTPSFQMSFAAVIALVSCYLVIQPFFSSFSDYGWARKLLLYFAGIITSSFIAGLATAPFAAYHFNNFAAYGMLTNLIAIPLTSLVIMPSGVVTLLLMPFGLENVGLFFMTWGINQMVDCANYIAALPQPIKAAQQMSQTSLALITIGGIWLLLWQTKLRLYGLIPLLLVIATLPFNNIPNIIIGGDAKLFAVKDQDDRLIFSSRTNERYSRQRWQEKYGQEEALTHKESDIVNCDDMGCIYRTANYTAVVANHPLALEKDCKIADILINLTHIRPSCNNAQIYLNKYDMLYKGTHTIKLTENNMIVKNVSDYRGNRLWNNLATTYTNSLPKTK